jgi:hypothetical protein
MRAELFSGICERTIPGRRSEKTSEKNDIQNRFMIMELRNAKIKKTPTNNNGTPAVNITWDKFSIGVDASFVISGSEFFFLKIMNFFLDESIAICFF